MSRDFTQEDIQMANKPMKTFAPLAIRKKEIRTTMAKIKNIDNTKCCQGCRERITHSSVLSENFGNFLNLKQHRTKLGTQFNNCTPKNLPHRNKNYVRTNTYTGVYSSFPHHHGPNWKQPRRLSTGERLTVAHPHCGPRWAVKSSRVLIRLAAWTALQRITLSVKEPNPKGYAWYDSIYVTFLKLQS